MTIRRTRIACWISKDTIINTQHVMFSVFHCNSGWYKAPHCYVIRTWPDLLKNLFSVFLKFWSYIFLWWVKDQQMHHSFNVLVLNILLHVSAFQNTIIRESNTNMFISDSHMMPFWNTETCRIILSTNTLNEWCICWTFTNHFYCVLLQ
jgi:hypothetical protein